MQEDTKSAKLILPNIMKEKIHLYMDKIKILHKNKKNENLISKFKDCVDNFRKTQDVYNILNQLTLILNGSIDIIMEFAMFLPNYYKIKINTNKEMSIVHDPLDENIVDYSTLKLDYLIENLMDMDCTNNLNRFCLDVNSGDGCYFGDDSKDKCEFDNAIHFVNKIKKRFNVRHDKYQQFLKILHIFQKEANNLKTPINSRDVCVNVEKIPNNNQMDRQKLEEYVVSQVSDLCSDEPDLIGEFTKFILEDGYKLEKSENMEESYTADQDVSNFDKIEIPIEKAPTYITELQVVKAKYPEYLENEYDVLFNFKTFLFQISSKVYVHFLKCFNLFQMNIIDGHCFMDMVFDYFQTNTELYELLLKIICGKNFEEKRVLVNSIAPNFTSCVKHTDGYYYFLEDDVRLPKSSYRNDLCNSVLNETCVIKPAALDLTEKKRNIEIIPIENLTNIEEERFETDNILGLTYDIINLFKVLCNHMSSLSVNDAKKFTVDAKFGGDSEILPTIAIKRIYGGAFDAIYKSCLINPTVAIPVVLRRLEQKYEEWNHIKSKYNYIWRRETFANLNYMINSEINANKSLMEKRIAPPQVLNNFTEYISEQPNKIRQISLSVFTKGYGDVYSKFVKLFVSYLEKKSIFTQNTIDRMVITICKFYPDLFGLGNCSFYPTTDFDSDVNDDSNQALHQTNLEKNSSFVKWNDSVPLDYNDKYKNLAIFFGDETFAVSMVYIAIVLNNIIAMIKLHKDVNEEHVPRYKLNCNETISKILKMCKSHPNRTDLDRFYYELERLITRTDDSAEVYFKNKFRKDAELILTLPKLFEHLSYNLQDIVNDSNRLIMMKSFYKYMNNGYSGFEEYHHKILEINAPQNGSEIIEITCHVNPILQFKYFDNVAMMECDGLFHDVIQLNKTE